MTASTHFITEQDYEQGSLPIDCLDMALPLDEIYLDVPAA
ncbi:hypothetical protein GCM10027019_17140 [Melaminivora jejuensis]